MLLPSLVGVFVQRIPTQEVVGLVGLYLLSFSQIANKTAALVGLLLMLLAAIAGWRSCRVKLAHSEVAWVALILSCYVVLRAVVGGWQHPTLAHFDYHSLTDWMLLPLFPLVAFYSQGDIKINMRVLALGLVGSLLGLGLRSKWPAIEQAWFDGGRVHWGLPFISSALYLGTVLIGWLAFAGRIMRLGGCWWLRIIAWLAMAAIMGEMLFLNQSRSVLLSLTVLLPIMGLIKLWRTPNRAVRRRGIVMAVALTFVVAVLAIANQGAIIARFHKTSETVQGMATFELKKIPETSLGRRVRLYLFGVHMWLERPIWGWGSGFEATTMGSNAPLDPIASRRYYPHLHDGYLETLVRFGIVGFGLAGLLAFFLVRDLWRAWRNGDLPLDMGLFLVASGLLAALTNLTDFRLTHKPYAFYTILLLGLVYGYVLKSQNLQHS